MTNVHSNPVWTMSPLGDLADDFISGGTPSTREMSYWEGDIPWTTSAPISENDIILSRAQRYITQEGLQNSASNIVPKGNLIVGTRVGVGKAVVNTIDIAISQDLTGVILNHKKVFPEFLAYYFKIQNVGGFFEGRKRGTTIKGISRFDLRSLEIDLPPLAEQRAIARVLRAVQAAREARLRELALERERKATLSEMFFSKRLVPPINGNYKINNIEWRKVKLIEVCKKIQDGSHFSPKVLYDTPGTGRYLYITSKNIKEGGIDLSNVQYVDHIFHKGIYNRCDPRKGDVLLIKDGVMTGVATVNTLDCEFSLLSSVVLLRTNENYLNPYFLKHFLNSPLGLHTITGRMTGSAIRRIILRDVKYSSIIIPRVEIQGTIANILNICEWRIAALDQEVSLLDELFQTMLEELMTGRLSTAPLMSAEPSG